MTAQEWLEELERLMKEATPGPWSKSEQGTNETYHHRIERYYDDKEVPEHIAYVVLPNVFGNLYDAAFIAAANPQTVQRLVEMVQMLAEGCGCDAEPCLYGHCTAKCMLEKAYEATEPKE